MQTCRMTEQEQQLFCTRRDQLQQEIEQVVPPQTIPCHLVLHSWQSCQTTRLWGA